MKKIGATRYITVGCLRAAGSVCLWTLWLVLGVVAIFLIRIAIFNHIAVPGPLLRRLEAELAKTGFAVTCSEARFDTQGHFVLIEPELYSASLGARVKAERVDTTVDLWRLVFGVTRVEEIHVSGGRIILPALISPTGLDLPVIEGIEATAVPRPNGVEIEDLKCRTGNLLILAKGAWDWPAAKATASPASKGEPSIAGILAACAAQHPLLSRFDSPVLKLELRSGWLDVDFFANGVRWPVAGDSAVSFGPEVLSGALEAVTRLPLSNSLPESFSLSTHLDWLKTETGMHARRIDAAFTVALPKGKPVEVERLKLTAEAIEARGQALAFPSIAASGNLDNASIRATARLWDETFKVTAQGNPAGRSGDVTLSGRISTSVLEGLSKVSGRPLTSFLQPEAPAPFEASASFVPGGKLKRVDGWFEVGPVVARHVPLLGASADLSLEGTDLDFKRIVLKTPRSHARGSYWMNTNRYDYRFLLTGHLQPADIDGWFREWWPHFWSSFNFTIAPVADVDISGTWGHPETSLVFVGAVADKPLVRETPFDHVATTLFIRPHFIDGLALEVNAAGKKATGTFTRRIDHAANALSDMTFEVASNLDLALCAQLFGKEGHEILSPFQFQTSPSLTLRGRIDGPAAPKGPGRLLDLVVKGTGDFRFHNFPLEGLDCTARIDGTTVDLPYIHTRFAGGTLDATARLQGAEGKRTLEFNGHLKEATLGSAIQAIENYSKDGTAEKTTFGQSKMQRQLAPGLLTLNLAAIGNYNDPYSFVGSGDASIKGAELAQINLLGQLSEVLRGVPLFNFTSFSLDSVQSRFDLKKNKLDFPYLRISGPSARLVSAGSYDLKAKDMQFDVAVFPFGQSSNVIASAMNIVLSPLSVAFELHLSGALVEPKWHFALGPTGIIRRISKEEENVAPSEERTSQPPPLLRRH